MGSKSKALAFYLAAALVLCCLRLASASAEQPTQEAAQEAAQEQANQEQAEQTQEQVKQELAAQLQDQAEQPQKQAKTAKKTELADEKVFDKGYSLFKRGKYEAAAARFHSFMEGRTLNDENYDWAAFFQGVCFQKMGLSHAAADALAHLAARKPNSRIVSYSLEILEQITRTKPFDKETIILDVLCNQNYDFTNDALSDFIHYYQGLFDWEHGYVEWGDEHFSQIRPDTYYYHKYKYQRALYFIYDDQIELAVKALRELVEDEAVDARIKDEAKITLARLLYELGDFDESFSVYNSVEMPNTAQARYLLERSWDQFRIGDPERAMGLLYAYEAPSFRRRLTPEYFILKSLIYKDVCQYRQALQIVDQFKAKFGEALGLLRQRGDMLDNDQLLLVLMDQKPIKELNNLLSLLSGELKTASSINDQPLRERLEKTYELQIQKTRKQLRTKINAAYDAAASEFLDFAEKANLLEYEIGLDMYQRTAEYHYDEKKEKEREEPKVKTVAYAFQGEFWNDELDDYRVVLENKCETLEEWDIFFQ